ncbi:MAG: 4Fe-4S dicluster domain-containing protein [Lysobacterales bacterium]
MTEPLSGNRPTEQACTRCGACQPVCPQGLSPMALHLAVRALDWPQLSTLRLNDCTECAACEPVCPSAIALVADFRFARAYLAWHAAERERADAARARYQARQKRLAAEEIGRQQRLRAAEPPAADAAAATRSMLEAALARARDKQKKRPS